MAYATPAQLATYVQSDVDTATAQLLLDLATARINTAAPVGITISDPPPADFLRICLQVAARAYGNPLGLKHAALGPESITFYANGLALTPDELIDVQRALMPYRPVVGTIHTPMANRRIRTTRDTFALDAERRYSQWP